jgi:hypothetical protein
MYPASASTSAQPASAGTVALGLLQLFTARDLHYACLNGYQDLPDVVPSDLDIVVDERDFTRAFDTSVDHFARHGYQLATALWYDVPRCWALVFMNASGEFIQIDLESDNAGIGRLGRSRHECLVRSERVGDLRVANDMSRAGYVVRKRQYKALTGQKEQLSYRAALAAIGVDDSPQDLSRTSFKRLHRRARLRDWTDSSFPWLSWATWRARRTWWRLRVPTGIVVGFVGPDGSGKTTTYTRLAELTRQTYQRVQVVHVRPGRILPSRHQGGGGSAPDREQGKSGAMALIKLGVMWVDMQTLRWDFMRARRQKTMVVWDRGAYDLELDPERHGVEGLPRLLRRAAVATAPRADLVVACVGDPEVFHARKPELPAQEVKDQVRRIERLRDVVRVRTDQGPVSADELSSLVLPTPAARAASHRLR